VHSGKEKGHGKGEHAMAVKKPDLTYIFSVLKNRHAAHKNSARSIELVKCNSIALTLEYKSAISNQ
jgi:hypothetical protein